MTTEPNDPAHGPPDLGESAAALPGASGNPEGGGSSLWMRVVYSPNGVRAGWRLAIFLLLVTALVTVARFVRHRFAPGPSPGGLRAGSLFAGLTMVFLFLLIASWVMTKIEGRRLADYGIPWRQAFGARFWEGLVWGFAALTVLLGVLRLTGNFHFGSAAIHGREIAYYAAAWGAAFLAVGFFEEYLWRGYAQFTLTTGIGFWPSAIVLSALFGAGHLGNPGETWLGGFTAGMFGLVLCLALRRTGNLWLGIGFHCSWDWGESFFYGVPDSGTHAEGHFLSPTFQGSKWMTGGTVGPEASVLCVIILVLLWLMILARFREVRYPNPSTLGDPRYRAG